MLKTFLIVMLVGKNPPVFCFKFLLCSKPWIKLLYILNRKMFFLESVPFMKNGWNRRLYFSFHFFYINKIIRISELFVFKKQCLCCQIKINFIQLFIYTCFIMFIYSLLRKNIVIALFKRN